MYLNRCKFEFSKDPRQFYNFVNAKRKSSALPSSVRLNSIEASTDPETADFFAEFFPSTYSSVSWSNSSYPNHLYRSNCIFSPVIIESSLLSVLETITPTYFQGPDRLPGCVLKSCDQLFVNPFLNFFFCLSHHLFFLLYGKILLLFQSSKRVRRLMFRTIEESPNCLQFLKYLNALLPLICNICAPL